VETKPDLNLTNISLSVALQIIGSGIYGSVAAHQTVSINTIEANLGKVFSQAVLVSE
jgi:hypothetical protein